MRQTCAVQIRDAKSKDVSACHAIERACFEASEAALERSIRTRQRLYPEGFLVAELAEQIVGFINSGATDRVDLADEAFKDMVGHDPDGANIVIFSVAVAPAIKAPVFPAACWTLLSIGRGCSASAAYCCLCKDELVGYYRAFGFQDMGPSGSSHGGFRWREMRRVL